MRHLCDSNVFVALVLSGHAHHTTALKWFDALAEGDTAEFCRMTQSSFLRLLTTDKITRPITFTNSQASDVLRTVFTDTRIGFSDEPARLEELWLMSASTNIASPMLWMDAYLAAFAELDGMRFVTFDKAFRQFPSLDLVVLN